MGTAIAVQDQQQAPISAYERALIFGDITELDERGRLEYLHGMCKASGLDPATRPFGYMEQWAPGGAKLVFYLTATGAAQLRTNHDISITRVVDEGEANDCYRWTVYGRARNGREDVEIGSASLLIGRDKRRASGLEYENLRKRALTQAKTRLAKSLTGLAGVLSEDEVDGTPTRIHEDAPRQITNGNGHTVNTTTGEVIQPAPVAAQPVAGPSREELKAVLPALKAEVRLWHPEANVPDASPATLTEARALHAVLKQHLKALPSAVTEDQTHAVTALVGRVNALGGDADMPEIDQPRQAWHVAWTAMRAEAERLAELVEQSPL